MPQRRRNYQEGDWFAIPLKNKMGYGIGRVARTGKGGVTLGYFFGPARNAVPTLEEIGCLTADKTILIRRFGDLALLTGEWIIIGQSDVWTPKSWPVPTFARIALDGTTAWREEYTDTNLSFLRSTQVEIKEVKDLPEDGLSGAEALVLRITQLLS